MDERETFAPSAAPADPWDGIALSAEENAAWNNAAEESGESGESREGLSAAPGENGGGGGDGDERFTLKYMGDERSVSRGDVIALAQKGMDYDRIRTRLEKLTSGNQERREADDHSAVPPLPEGGNEDGFAARRDREIDQLLAWNSGIKAEDIPPSVWREVKEGAPLLTATLRAENQSLKRQLEAERQNAKNTARSTGSQGTAGSAGSMSEAERDWYSDD